jgi:hypothetical protein
MTTETVVAKVRDILNDRNAPYRWSEETVGEHLVLALRRLAFLAPQTRYVNGVLSDITALPEDGSAALAVDDRYEEALVYYVVHLCYNRDDPDTSNAELANSYLTKAERLMV